MKNDYRINDVERKLNIARFRPLDVMVTGATGAGKSSTLNMLFEKTVAKVGENCDPETMALDDYRLNDAMRFWDTPGLGDGATADEEHSKKLINLLYKDYFLDGNQYGFIDTVLVIVDGTGRDMGTVYKLLNEVIVPNFQKDRIMVAINQADVAMKGRHWDAAICRPDAALEKFLNEKAESIQSRVREATGVTIRKPVYYSAEYGYNTEVLMDLIIDNMPCSRRKPYRL